MGLLSTLGWCFFFHDLFDVHFVVLDLLEKQGIELETSDFGDSCGGLPYLYSLEIIDE